MQQRAQCYARTTRARRSGPRRSTLNSFNFAAPAMAIRDIWISVHRHRDRHGYGTGFQIKWTQQTAPVHVQLRPAQLAIKATAKMPEPTSIRAAHLFLVDLGGGKRYTDSGAKSARVRQHLSPTGNADRLVPHVSASAGQAVACNHYRRQQALFNLIEAPRGAPLKPRNWSLRAFDPATGKIVRADTASRQPPANAG